ncbi:WD40 repeat-like protein [Myotisia sp. PD_48]|nr:WD40 repeat-like protein [Myotisia sp. PD_48]
MPIKNESIWAPCPSTTRGMPTQLSSDPKGERLAYASNKSIFLRSIDNPALSTQYTSHVADTTVARFSPSGYYVASGDESGVVRVWDCVGDGITKGEYSVISGRINDLAWDGDSQRIFAVGDGNNNFGRFISADSGNSVGEVTGHGQRINSVSIRQQRPLRAAGVGDDRTLVFYHGAPFKFNTSVRNKHTNFIYGVDFSPNGEHLLTAGADKRIWIYDGKTGEAKGQIGDGEHKGSIFSMAWAPDSKRFVTASGDRTVKIWDVEHGKVIQNWVLGDGVPDQQVGVVWPAGRQDGLIISLSLSGTLNYLVEGSDKPTRNIKGHQKNITSLASYDFNPSKTFWTGSYDGRVCQWDLGSGSADIVKGTGHSSYIAGLAATEEKTQRIYRAGWDDTLRSVNTASNEYTEDSAKLSGQPKGVVATGDLVLVINGDIVEGFVNNTKVHQFQCKKQATAVAATGSTVAIGLEDSTVCVGKVDEGGISITTTVTMSRNPITALALTADASTLAAGDSKGKVTIFKVADGTVVCDRWNGHTGRVQSLAWNTQGTHLVTGSLDKTIFIRSLAHPSDSQEMSNAHVDGINAVTWMADGSRVISAGMDGAVKIWHCGRL